MPDAPAPPTTEPAAPDPAPPSTTTMSPVTDPDPRHELVACAERAAMTGDRSALLTYMRLKRSFA